MRATFSLYVILCLGFARVHSQPLQPAPQSTESSRIERLAGLAKVWGAVKFFHPYLAYKEIDWDKALVEAIPKVAAAKTPQEYEAAINSMLAVLTDKNTRAEVESESKPESRPNSSPGAKNSDPVTLEDGVLVIEVMAIAETLASNRSAAQRIYAKITSMTPQARAFVLDCRPKRELSEADFANNYYFSVVLRGTVSKLSSKPVRLGSLRYRMHNGYAPQSGRTSGGYYSALVETAPETIAGTSENALPVAIIVNEKTPGESQVFEGLQAGGKVAVVLEGDCAVEFGVVAYKIRLPDGVTVKMRTTENVNPDGSIGFRPDASVPQSDDDGALKEAMRIVCENRFDRPTNQAAPAALQRDAMDHPYPQMQFPTAEYRLLALFRFWNVVSYFYPYKNLLSESWETVLPRYIARFEAAKDALDYQTIVREVVTEIHDSHGFVRNTTKVDEAIGAFGPPLLLRYVENQTVVAKVLDDKAGLRAGDVILAIDGEPIERRREALAKLFAASTPQALNWRLNGVLFLGEKESQAKLDVRDLEGKTKEVEVVRSQS